MIVSQVEKENDVTNYDFSCYVLKYEVESIRGLRYKKDLFNHQNGEKVPLIWNYKHHDPESNLGYVVLENRYDGVYAYCYLSDTPSGKAALDILDCVALGPCVVGYKIKDKYIVDGRIANCSLMCERIDDNEAYHPVLNKDKKGEQNDN